MKSFAINLSTIFTEFPFLDRFQKAHDAGFSYVECQFPYPFSLQSLTKALQTNKLHLVLLNLPPGNWEQGDRGLAIDPDQVFAFRESVEVGMTYAKTLNCSQLHCMAGVLPPHLDKQTAREVFTRNVREAAQKLAVENMTLLLEPINQIDMPGYFLADIHEAAQIIHEINLPNVKLQFDFYHIQSIHGEVLSLFEQYFDLIGHVQMADVPGRGEPGTGTLDYKRIFDYMAKLHYEGYTGLEYTPIGKSENSFSWLTGGTLR